MSSTALQLKHLREAARPTISIRQMAALLEMDPSTYVFYERPDRFKKDRLPIDLARKIAAILEDRGVSAHEVMALAGVGGEEAPALSAGEEQLLDRFRHLDPDQRRLLLALAEQMERRSGGPAGGTVHSPPFPAQGSATAG